MTKPFRPETRLIILPEIRTKIIEKHGLEIEFVKGLFRRYEWKARKLPPEPNDPYKDIPRYLADIEENGKRYRLVFAMKHPPGTEAILISCYPDD